MQPSKLPILQSFEQSQLYLEQISLQAPVGTDYLLRHICFEVAQGECLGLVGASGSGKTSLLRLLNRLSEASQGKIYFEKQDIRQIPVTQLRQQISLVAQESKLLGMTVRQTLTYPLVLQKLDQPTIEQRLQIWMEQLHLPSEWLERTEVQLSVGQRQLVAIGRALMMHPKVLLLDEPTSALDAGRSEHLLRILQDVVKNTQTTILMANHQLDLVEQFCSRLIYLKQGVLTQNLPADQVDWFNLKQSLIDEEIKTAKEWE